MTSVTRFHLEGIFQWHIFLFYTFIHIEMILQLNRPRFGMRLRQYSSLLLAKATINRYRKDKQW